MVGGGWGDERELTSWNLSQYGPNISYNYNRSQSQFHSKRMEKIIFLLLVAGTLAQKKFYTTKFEDCGKSDCSNSFKQKWKLNKKS